MGHLSQMELFWSKVSLASAQNLALTEEKHTLEKENEKLKNMIRQYCHHQAYNSVITSLNLSPYPSLTLPAQETSHMKFHINKFDKSK